MSLEEAIVGEGWYNVEEVSRVGGGGEGVPVLFLSPLDAFALTICF